MVDLGKLTPAIERHANVDGAHETAVPGLLLFRASSPSNHNADLYEPSLCVVAQGAKEVVLEGEAYRYDPAHSLLVSVDLPVTSRVVDATPDRPCMVVRVSLDPAVVGELLAEGTARPSGQPVRGIAASPVDPLLFDAVTRFESLLDRPRDIWPLVPLHAPGNYLPRARRAAGGAPPPDRLRRYPQPSESRGPSGG